MLSATRRVLAVALLSGIVFTSQAKALFVQPPPHPHVGDSPLSTPLANSAKFRIKGFTVFVAPTQGRSPDFQPGKKITGDGFIFIHTQRVGVSFINIVTGTPQPGTIPTASGGAVIGKKGPTVDFLLDANAIKMKRDSIRITPVKATANIEISFPHATFIQTGTTLVPSLNSTECEIAQDGSIYATNFRGSTPLVLKNTVYQLELDPGTGQTVRLYGSPTTSSRPSLVQGVQLTGLAYFVGTRLFTFQGRIQPDGRAAEFNLTLLTTPAVERSPEVDYKLVLHGGTVRYQYAKDGRLTCDGRFSADVSLPPAIMRFDSQPVVLQQLTLQTDESGALFGNITIPYQLRTGFSQPGDSAKAIFLVQPDKDASWIYFPRWQSPVPMTNYPAQINGLKPNEDCGGLLEFLGNLTGNRPGRPKAPIQQVVKRAGVTVLSGTLFFKSPQSTVPTTEPTPQQLGQFNLKTLFWGDLTLTPWGITGSLTSSGCSLIPSGSQTTNCSIPFVPTRRTFEQIISDGNTQPQSPAGRFTLAGLRILEMRIEKLALCMNALPSKGASMRYVAHFPCPSFIDLEFADDSLDSGGRFNVAAGPIASKSWHFPTNPTRDDIDKALSGYKGPAPILIPDTQILWQWRLPVSFSDRGVTITYPNGTGRAEVTVTMKPNNSNGSEISSSELWIRPLYSRNSAIKSGVRFSAKLTPGGSFSLTGWDTNPFLSKVYARPGNEEKIGFDCQLAAFPEHALDLVDASSNPLTRNVDVTWKGIIKFPFFGGQACSFQVRSASMTSLLLPEMTPIAQLKKTGYGYYSCSLINDPNNNQRVQENALTTADLNNIITVTMINVIYSNTSYPFQSQKIVVKKSDNEIQAPYAFISSFINAGIQLSSSPGQDKLLPVNTTSESCGSSQPAKHVLLNARSSADMIDLICYDQEAYQLRGLEGACCRTYWLGTYRISTTSGGIEKVIFEAKNTKWYPDLVPFTIFMNNSDVILNSDQPDTSHQTFINIPGAGLKIDNGALIGAFGATTSSIASSLPYEGEFRFYLDSKCGYYYLLTAGSFTYGLRFSGEILIVNAPYKTLKRPADFIGETQLLETLSSRALFYDIDTFQTNTGLDKIQDDTIVTGIFQCGSASFTYGYEKVSIDLAAGLGTYIFQFKNPGEASSYCAGIVNNGRASASVALANAQADINLSGSSCVPAISQLEDLIKNSTIQATGKFVLCVCIDAWLAHAETRVDGNASYSSKTGFKFSGQVSLSAGAGGCHACQ